MDSYQQQNDLIQTLSTTVPQTQQQNITNTTIPVSSQHIDNQQQIFEKLTPHSNGTTIEIKSPIEKVENNLCNCYPIEGKEKNSHQTMPAHQQPLLTASSQIGMENSTHDKLLIESSTKPNHSESTNLLSSSSSSSSNSNLNLDSHTLDIEPDDSEDKRQNLSDMELDPINNESVKIDEDKKPFITSAVEQKKSFEKQHVTADNCTVTREFKSVAATATTTITTSSTTTDSPKPVDVISNSETKISPKLLPEQKPHLAVATTSPSKQQNTSSALLSPLSSVSKQQHSPLKGSTKSPDNSKPQEEQQLKTPRRETKPPIQKSSTSSANSNSNVGKIKRQRIKTQHYQSPIPEMELISKKINSSSSVPRSKLIIFYKNEFLAVRNPEGSFYLCQTVQNIYKTSQKIKVRWLSQDKNNDKTTGEDVYTPDFYDTIEIDCILTSLKLNKIDKGKKYRLPSVEKNRTQSILNRALAVEKGEKVASPSITEEHPDVDLSLYKDENQLKKGKRNYNRKRKASDSDTESLAGNKSSPPNAKLRKIMTPSPKKNNASSSKKTPVATTSKEPAKKTNTSKKRTSGRSKKVPAKPNAQLDQKKAKVLAKIGRKAAVRSKSNQNNHSKKATVSSTKSTPNTRRATAALSSTRASSSGTQTRKSRY